MSEINEEYKKYLWCNHMATGGSCCNPKYNNYCGLGGYKHCNNINDCDFKDNNKGD